MKTKLIFGVALIILAVSITIITVPTVYSETTQVKIQLSGEKIEQADPAVADFDGDGDLEIVVGGIDGMLYVLAYNGSNWAVVWSRQTAFDLLAGGAPTSCETTSKSDIRSAPAIADLDGDGKLDIVVTTGGDPGKHRNGGVLVYKYNYAWNFTVASGWPKPTDSYADSVGSGAGASNPDGCWDGIWGSPALGDVDGDGDLEIAVEGFDRRIHLWHHDGTAVDGWPINGTNDGIHRGGWSSPALADIDDDGRLEIIVGSDDFPDNGQPPYYFYVFNDDSSILFRKETSKNTVSSPAVGDIDGDGKLDIVVGTGGYPGDGHKVYAWDNQGNDLPGWPKSTGGDMPASPALGDLDGDGSLEVVIGCGKEGDASPAPCQYLYAFHGDGSTVAGFPTIPENQFSWESPMGLPYTPIVADYDGDGSIEILVLKLWSWGLSTVESNGQSNNNPAFVTESTLGSSPVVADVDHDGVLEIIIGGMNNSGRGMVYIWDGGGSVDSKQPWPMFHRNVARTGLAEEKPKLGNVSEIIFFYDTKTTQEVTLTQTQTIENIGGGSFDWNGTHTIPNLQITPTSDTLTRQQTLQFSYTIPTSGSGLFLGWNDLGNVTIEATDGDGPITGSPQTIAVKVFVGDLKYTYLPLIMR